jgi:hypothetical protein
MYGAAAAQTMPNMSINDGSPREFVASREIYSTSWIKGTKIWQAVYTVFFVAFVGFAVFSMAGTARGHGVHLPRYTPLIMMAVLLGGSAIVGVYMLVRWRQKYVLSVAGDSLTVGSRGEVYSLADAQLGLWPNMGVALHLHSGGRRFVLGGHGRRIGPTTPLDAEPISVVDARLPASEFDEVLRLGGRTAARGPAPGDPTRCILWPTSHAVANMGAFAFRQKQRLMNSLEHAHLFIDVDGDTIRIVDPETHVVETSTSVSRITATPLTYESYSDESNRVYRTPTLSLSVPGLPVITFGCPHDVKQFSWRGSSQVVKEPPLYRLSGADWTTLVETFRVAANVEDATPKG